MGPTPLIHGLKRRAWNRLLDRLDLLDNKLIVVLKLVLTSPIGLCMVPGLINLGLIGVTATIGESGWSFFSK